MTKKKKITFVVISLALFGLIATAGLTSAHFGGLGFDAETKEQIEEAVENKDYDSWKDAHDSVKRITDYIDNQENFEKFLEMKELMKEGEFVAADQIREELGLPEKGHQRHTPEEMEAIFDAIEAKDYEAWQSAHNEDDPILETIDSQEKFDQFVEMKEAMRSGDHERAEELREELGIKGKGRGSKQGGMFGGRRRSEDSV